MPVNLFFYFTNFIEMQLIHNIVLVSAIQQNDSVLFIYVLFLLEYNCFSMLCQFLLHKEVNQSCAHRYPLPLGPASYPTASCPSRSSQSTNLSFLCLLSASHGPSSSTHGSVYVSTPIFRPVTPFPSSPCQHVCSLCLHLCFCLGNRSMCTIFLDSIYTC